MHQRKKRIFRSFNLIKSKKKISPHNHFVRNCRTHHDKSRVQCNRMCPSTAKKSLILLSAKCHLDSRVYIYICRMFCVLHCFTYPLFGTMQHNWPRTYMLHHCWSERRSTRLNKICITTTSIHIGFITIKFVRLT